MKKTLSIFSVLVFALVICVASGFAQQIEIRITISGEPVKGNNVVTPEYPRKNYVFRSSFALIKMSDKSLSSQIFL